MLWFTADPHFGHAGIIRHCGRPFRDVEEMNDELIRRWNACVDPTDIVWLLGDICFVGEPWFWLDQLNGEIWVCIGNHDKPNLLRRWSKDRVFDVRFIRWQDHRFFVSHYAHRTWPGKEQGVIHLYGHSHGSLPGVGRSMDVGVDANDSAYAPWSATEIIEKMNKVLLPEHVDFRED